MAANFRPLTFGRLLAQVQNYLPIVLGGVIPLLHMPLPDLSPGSQSISEKQRALQQGLADTEKRQILQKLTQIGGVQRYKDELQQALAGI